MTKGRRRFIRAWVLLALGGLASWALGGPAAAASLVRISGPSPFASCTIGGPGTNYVNAEVEPYLGINPTNSSNLVGVFQQDRWSNGGAHGLVATFSSDGGATWGETPLSFNESNPNNAVAAATSADGGQTWRNIAVLIADTSAQFFNDKESVTADP